MSPLWQRRFAAFAAHRRGRVSLIIFALVAGLSLCANIIANDRPLIVVFHGHLYFPIFQRIPETVFGPGFLPTEADYTDPLVKSAIRAQGWMLWPTASPGMPAPRRRPPMPGIGWGRMTSRATCWRACSMACAFQFYSALP